MNRSSPVDPTLSGRRSDSVASFFLFFLFQTTRDRLGQTLRSVEALGTPAQRVTRLRWHASGQMSHLILENPATGEQVTEWIFGTTLTTSGVARNNLVSGKVWPTGESESYLFNRQSNVTQRTDPNGSVRQFTYDQLGQPINDAATTVGAGVDATMRRVSTVYNNRGQRDTVTTYDAANGGTAINQVKFDYDAFGLMIADKQEHTGTVTGSTPSVTYGYSNGSGNVLRRESVTAPSGTQVDYAYGASGSLDQVLNRVASLKFHGDTLNLVEYTWAGFGRLGTLTYPTPGAALSYLTAGEPVGDAGDPYTGTDRFGRVVDLRWQTTGGSPALLDRVQWGYDRASNRTWRRNLVAPSGQDDCYGYDGLYQVTDAARGDLNINRTAIGGIPAGEQTFTYDPTGNWQRTTTAEAGVETLDQSRVHNRDNQLTQIDGSNSGILYDRAGNALRMPPTRLGDWAQHYRLTWDAWNRLVRVQTDDEFAPPVAEYTYDGAFRRITVSNGIVTIGTYYNDLWRPVEERIEGQSDPLRQYVWGARPGHRDELILRDRDTGGGSLDERLYCLMDYFDPTAVIDPAGAVVERYGWSAFGQRRVMDADWAPLASSAVAFDFGFHGQFLDSDTGYYNYGYRYYSLEIGRWLSRDPAESPIFNLYLFTDNSSIQKIDFLGLASVYCSDYDPNAEFPMFVYYIKGPLYGTPPWNIQIGATESDGNVHFHVPNCYGWIDPNQQTAMKGTITAYKNLFFYFFRERLKFSINNRVEGKDGKRPFGELVSSFARQWIEDVGFSEEKVYGADWKDEVSVSRVASTCYRIDYTWEALNLGSKKDGKWQWAECEPDCPSPEDECCKSFTPKITKGTYTALVEFRI